MGRTWGTDGCAQEKHRSRVEREVVLCDDYWWVRKHCSHRLSGAQTRAHAVVRAAKCRPPSTSMSCVCNGCKIECTCAGGNCCCGCCSCWDLDDDCAAQPSLVRYPDVAADHPSGSHDYGQITGPRVDQIKRDHVGRDPPLQRVDE
jgi:hypothetical protein